MLNIEEVVEGFFDLSDGVEVNGGGGHEEAAIGIVEEFAEGSDVLLALDLAGEHLVEVLQHDQSGALVIAVGATDGGDEAIDDEVVVFFGFELLVEVFPLGFVGGCLAQDFAEAEDCLLYTSPSPRDRG